MCVQAYFSCYAASVIYIQIPSHYKALPHSNLLQIKFAQSGEDILFNVLCKDFFNNSQTCLMSVNEANQKIEVRMAGMCMINVMKSQTFVAYLVQREVVTTL